MAERFMVGETALPQGVAIPENLTRKVERNRALLKQKTDALAAIKSANKVKRHDLKMRATKYEAQYRQQARKLVQMRRQAKATGNYFVEPEAKVLYVMRFTGINKMAPKPRKILKLLRLDQLHKGVFVKTTKPMLNMLKCVQPYVIMGTPNLKTTKLLLTKRGYAKINGERKALNNNEMISAQLGKYGIHGMDDLIHEIHTAGPHFKQASNFLYAFKLSCANGGFVRKKHGYHEPKGGDWGNREEKIDELLRRML